MNSLSVHDLCHLDRDVLTLLRPLTALLFLASPLLVFLSPAVGIAKLLVSFFVTLHQLVVFSPVAQPESVVALVAWAVLDPSLVVMLYPESVRGFE